MEWVVGLLQAVLETIKFKAQIRIILPNTIRSELILSLHIHVNIKRNIIFLLSHPVCYKAYNV